MTQQNRTTMETINVGHADIKIMDGLDQDVYHGPVEGGDKLLLSSSRIKQLVYGGVSGPGNKTAELGHIAHEYVQAWQSGRGMEILPPFVGDDGAALRSNSTLFKQRLAELEARPENQGKTIRVLNNTDYKAVCNGLVGVKEYLAQYWMHESYEEQSIFIGPQAVATAPAHTPGGEATRKEILRLFPGHGIKARPDFYCRKDDKTAWSVIDWKTTTKKTLEKMLQDATWLDYWFSLRLYALAVELATGHPVEELALAFLVKSAPVGVHVVRCPHDARQLFAGLDGDDPAKRVAASLAREQHLRDKKFVIINRPNGR